LSIDRLEILLHHSAERSCGGLNRSVRKSVFPYYLSCFPFAF
jgi:hypothetical protein